MDKQTQYTLSLVLEAAEVEARKQRAQAAPFHAEIDNIMGGRLRAPKHSSAEGQKIAKLNKSASPFEQRASRLQQAVDTMRYYYAPDEYIRLKEAEIAGYERDMRDGDYTSNIHCMLEKIKLQGYKEAVETGTLMQYDPNEYVTQSLKTNMPEAFA